MRVELPPVSRAIEGRARQLVRDINAIDVEYLDSSTINEEYVAMCSVWYQGTSRYKIEYAIVFSKDRKVVTFNPSYCSCPHNVDVCKHMYAAMLRIANDRIELDIMYDEFVERDKSRSANITQKEDEWDAMFEGLVDDVQEVNPQPRRVNRMRNDYTDKLLNSAVINSIIRFEKEEYEFEPELIINNTENEMGLKLKVKIIGGKSYVIKDIYELPLLFQNKLSQTFGANTDVIFVREKFKNKELVDYLIREINRGCALLNTVSAKGKTDWYGYYTPGKVQYDKKQLQLSPGTLLRYLEIMDNRCIRFKYEKERIADYDVRTVNRKYQLDIEDYGDYATLESKEILQFIQYRNKVMVIDPFWKKIEINDLGTAAKAEAMCNLFNYHHLINQEDARMLNESIIKPLAPHIEYDFDFTKLYPDVTYIGFKSHLSLIKDKLNVAIALNTDQIKEPLVNGAIEVRVIAIINQFLELYDQPEFSQESEVGSIFEIKGINKIIEFVNEYLQPLEELCEVITSNEEFKNFKIVEKVPVEITQTSTNGKSILKFESSEFSESELLAVLKSINSFENYLALDSGKVIDLNSAEVKEVIEAANKLDLDLTKAKSTEFEVELASVFYYNKIFDSLYLLVNQEEVIEDLVTDYNNLNSKFRKPKNLLADLRNYQKYGVNWIKFLEKYNFGGILADDMGLGKTLQVISHLSSVKSKLPTIIITPASLIYNWKYEFEKFTNQTELLLIDGGAKERKELIANITNQVCIISYDTFKRDYEELSELKFNYIILDEAQHIKNHNTKIAKAVKAIDSQYRLALTGTPIENNLNELWSLFDFIMPSFLGPNKEFKKKYITPIENGRSEVQEQLKQKISPFILRRLKTEVLAELPAKTEKVIHIKMQEDQQKLYDSYAMELRNFLDKTSDAEMKTKQIEVLAMITKLRQIACNPILQNSNYKGSSSKQEYLIDHLETLIENKHKTVLFSQFVLNFEHIEKQLEKNGIKYYKITGQTPKQKRFELVDTFNQDDTPVFLISLKAGGTGLNITGADTVIHYDPWWNTAVESQATDRVHRMGQTKNVFVYKLICEKTIEEQIIKLQEQKRELAENLLDSDNIKSNSLTKEDIINLI